MGKNVRKLATVILALIFLVSTAVVICQAADRSEAADVYSEAEKIALSGGKREETPLANLGELRIPEETRPQSWIPEPAAEEDANMAYLEKIDLDALREENEEVVGWIHIPGTRINYPIMQGQDNQYYLKHTWNNYPNGAGSIFLEHQNSADLTDFNTVIYGHNMADGSMFAALHSYAYSWFAEKNPYVYVKTDAGVWRYEVFASYNASTEGTTYGLSFNEEQTRQDFLDAALAQSQIRTKVIPEITDRILTLSTCTGGGYDSRRVVLARLKMILEE